MNLALAQNYFELHFDDLWKPYSKLLSLFMVKFKTRWPNWQWKLVLVVFYSCFVAFYNKTFWKAWVYYIIFQLSLMSKSENFLELLCCWLCQVVLQRVSVLGRHPNVHASGTTICLSLARLFLSLCTQAMEEVECLSVSAWITLLVLLGSKYWR